jgi:hypothetical protein
MKRMTMAMIAMAAMPAILTAQQPQQDTSRTQIDSARTNMQRQADTSGAAAQGTATGRRVNQMNESGDTTSSALRDSLLRANQQGQAAQEGQAAQQGQAGQQDEQGQTMGQRSGRNARGSLGLSRDQVMQLQQALTSAGCDAGTADGVVGRKTRQAMQCARQQLGVSGNDNQALFQALNLDFASQQGQQSQQDTSGAATTRTQSADPATQAVQGDSSEVGGRNAGRVRPPEDTTARVGGQQMGDTTAANRARQQGMTDSTMMRPDSMHSPMDSTMGRPTSPTMRDTTRRIPPQR